MAYPTLQAQAKAASAASNTTSHPITLPAHAAGDMLFVVFTAAGSSTHTAVQSGWTQVLSGGSTLRQSLYTKIAASSSEALTITTGSATQSSHTSNTIRPSSGNTISVEVDAAGTASGYGNNTYSGGFNPTAGNQQYLTFTTVGNTGNTVYPNIAYGGGNLYTQAAAGSGGASTGTMNDSVTTSSISDASFDSNPSAVDWRSYQVVFWEVPSGPTPTNYTLTCDTASYSLTGQAAILRRGFTLVADTGSYGLTGIAAALRRGYSLVADAGSYSLTGQDAALRRGYSLTADVGAYALTGQDATLIYTPGGAGYTLSCDSGSYSLTGYDANLIYTPGAANYSLVCDVGAYSLTGQSVVTSFGRRMVADVGSYSLTGESATTSLGRRLVADVGAYALTGHDATLTATASVNYSLTCDTGAYLLTGNPAELLYSGGMQDTHDGFWAKQWDRIREREKKKHLEEIREDIEELDEQIAEVQAAEPPKPVKKAAKAPPVPQRDFYAEQARVIEQLIAERQRLIEMEEEEMLLLL